MASFHLAFCHIIFSTKNRAATLPAAHSAALYEQMKQAIKKQRLRAYAVGGTENHLHILSNMPIHKSLNEYVAAIQSACNDWMQESGLFPDFAGWQDGYAAFTCSPNEMESLMHYIQNQQAHHQHETFEAEYRRILIENEIEFKEDELFG